MTNTCKAPLSRCSALILISFRNNMAPPPHPSHTHIPPSHRPLSALSDTGAAVLQAGLREGPLDPPSLIRHDIKRDYFI